MKPPRNWGNSHRVKPPLGPGFPHQLSQQSWLGMWLGSGRSGVRAGRQSCALCLSSPLSPAGWLNLRCSAPDCPIFPVRCHQERGASSHPEGSAHFPTLLVRTGPGSVGQPRVKRALCPVVAMSQGCECPQSSQLGSEGALGELRSCGVTGVIGALKSPWRADGSGRSQDFPLRRTKKAILQEKKTRHEKDLFSLLSHSWGEIRFLLKTGARLGCSGARIQLPAGHIRSQSTRVPKNQPCSPLGLNKPS